MDRLLTELRLDIFFLKKKAHYVQKTFKFEVTYRPTRPGVLIVVSEYDQEIPQPQTTDNPVAPRGRAAQPSRDTRRTN